MVTKNKFNEQCITYGQMNMIFNSRIFWRRFTTWIRVYIISRYMGIGSEEEGFGRLYLETSSVGNILQIIFEREDSNQLSRLLNQLTFSLRDLITAQLQGNREAMNQNVNRLYETAADIAAFLASINPYVDETEWRGMLETYIQYTIREANSFITRNYSQDIGLFEELTALTDKMGDLLAQAVYDLIMGGSQNTDNLPPRSDQQCITYEQMNQIYNIRMFWFESVLWTRAYMLSRYSGIGNAEEVKARLQQVPAEYLDTLEQVFGERIETDLQLLTAYIDLIDALITAQSAGNTEEVDRITRLLYQNADQRAAFLASLNPYWDEDDWRRRLYNNLRSTIEESITFLTGDYARNLDIFSTLLDQAESTSGYFARGLFSYIKNR